MKAGERRGGNVCQRSIRWTVKQKLQLFSQSRRWLSWLLLLLLLWARAERLQLIAWM